VQAVGGSVRQAAPGEPWEAGVQSYTLYGASVAYIQEWAAAAPLAGVGFRFLNFIIRLRFAASPGVRGSHLASHYFRVLEEDGEQRYIQYEDSVRGGLYYCIAGEWEYIAAGRVGIGVRLQWRSVEGARGGTKTRTAGLAGYEFSNAGAAGAAVSVFTFGAVLRVRI
jgi:outer membrane protease